MSDIWAAVAGEGHRTDGAGVPSVSLNAVKVL